MADWLGPLVLALGIGLVATPALRVVALRTGFVDRPSARKAHTRPVPYLGGVAIMVGTFAALMAGPTPPDRALVLGIAAVGLGFVGLLDDRFVLPAWPRVVVQTAAAAAALAVGVQVDIVGVGPIDAMITLVWFLAVTNAMNLVDNMDGLSGGLAVAMALGTMALAAFAGQSVVGALAGALAGATLGYLAWNLSPRRIFMGDAGALFVGYVLAVVIVEASPLGGRWSGVVVAGLLVGVPALDLLTVVAGRFLHDAGIGLANKDHLSHRLVARGLSSRAAVAVLVLAQGLLSAVAVGVGRQVIPAAGGVVAGVAVGAALVMVTQGLGAYPNPVLPKRRRWAQAAGALCGVVTLGVLAAAWKAPGGADLPDVLVGGSSEPAAYVVLSSAVALIVIVTASFTLLTGGRSPDVDTGQAEELTSSLDR